MSLSVGSHDGLSRAEQLRSRLTPAEWRRASLLVAAIALLHIVGFGLLFGLVAPADYRLATGGVFGVSLGLTAYTLGMRHAFDADHIAAIDNTTRKLMAEGQRPLSVGFFFALGHSTIVFLLGCLVVFGVQGLTGAVENEDSTLHTATGLWGPLISGLFLVSIGILNLMILLRITSVFRRLRRGLLDEAELERELETRGVLYRLFARAVNRVRKPWHMYPLGFLFGLGFDTATEIALLVIAGGAASSGLPFYAILCLPILFAAGMVLLDSIDGAFMNFAYGWAFSKPIRKLYYNVTITGLSVGVALIIGVLSLTGVLVDELGLSGGLWDVLTGLDLEYVGYAIVVLFLLTWFLSVMVWRYGRVEERWSRRLETAIAERS